MDDIDENVLNIQQRQKRAAIMRRYATKIEIAKERAKKKVAPEANIKKRAYAMARQIVRNRLTSVSQAEYEKMGPSEKMAIDRIIEKKGKAIKKLALRLIPKVKKAEYARLQSYMHGQAMKNQGAPEGHSQVKEELNDLFLEYFGDSAPGNTGSTGERSDSPISSSGRKVAKSAKGDSAGNAKGGTKSKGSPIVQYGKFGEDLSIDSSEFRGLVKKADKTGIDLEILGEVYNRGLDAWSEDYNVTPTQYAFARVNSYINQGRTYFNEDADLHEETPVKVGDTVYLKTKKFANSPHTGKVVKVTPTHVHLKTLGGTGLYKAPHSSVTKDVNQSHLHVNYMNKNEEVELDEGSKMKGKDPCWKGYHMVGKKMKNGKEVPNCVAEAKFVAHVSKNGKSHGKIHLSAIDQANAEWQLKNHPYHKNFTVDKLVKEETDLEESNNKPYVKPHIEKGQTKQIAWKASNKHGHVKYFGLPFKKAAEKHAGLSEEVESNLDEMAGANMDRRALVSHISKKGWSKRSSGGSGDHEVYEHPKSTHKLVIPRHNKLKAPLILDVIKKSKILDKTNEEVESVKEDIKPNYRTGNPKIDKAREAHWNRANKLSDRNPKAYKPAPGDATAKTKPSQYTNAYHDKFGESVEELDEVAGLSDKAKKSGISLGTLQKVYRRGVAAWNSGHRPGTTPQQWGMARVNSYIMKGKTYHTADKDLHEEADLDEVYQNDIKQENKLGSPSLGKTLRPGHKHIGTLPNGHEVHFKKAGSKNQYRVIDPKTKTVNTVLTTKPHEGKGAEEIDTLVANHDSGGAHHLYQHLVLKHDKVLSSNNQSAGARRVWAKAASHRSIHTHGYDPKTNSAFHAHPTEDEHYSTDSDYDNVEKDMEKSKRDKRKYKKELQDIASNDDKYIVMHKKGLKEQSVTNVQPLGVPRDHKVSRKKNQNVERDLTPQTPGSDAKHPMNPSSDMEKQQQIHKKIIDEESETCTTDPNKPTSRLIGTKSLVKTYKKATPGEGINEAFNIAFAAGIGETYTASDLGMKMQGGFALHPSVTEDVTSAEKAPVVVPAHLDAYGNVIPAKTVLRKLNRKIIKSGNVHNGDTDQPIT